MSTVRIHSQFYNLFLYYNFFSLNISHQYHFEAVTLLHAHKTTETIVIIRVYVSTFKTIYVAGHVKKGIRTHVVTVGPDQLYAWIHEA